jgi:exopolysaccharide biosynthesis polyprenyl glycosylphosphotransferase
MSPLTEKSFPIELKQETAIIHLPLRLTVLEAMQFKQTFHDLVEHDQNLQQIILDCEKTTFIDSSGVGALVSNIKIARIEKVSLKLLNVQLQFMSVLSMTGLENILDIDTAQIPEENIESQSTETENLPITHPSITCRTKRIIDITGSLVGLLITAIIFIPIAIAIKIDSPGSILFNQTRCGWMGKRFKIWKFRSMCNNAEVMKSQIENQISGALFKNENDPRITKVGRFLRKTSLDEFPQFWNVLKGDMSLVGTRPPTPDEVEKYEVPEWQRLDVKPGITGEWQVNGRSKIRTFEDVIKLDLIYQKNWSFMYDIKLLFKTLFVLLHKDSGAI